MTVGNHEFNYGLEHLAAFEEQLDAALIAANVFNAGTDDHSFTPYVMLTVEVEGYDSITVGVLGLTPPGSAIWDAADLEGRVEFSDATEEAKKYVPEMRTKGADVVVVGEVELPETRDPAQAASGTRLAGPREA